MVKFERSKNVSGPSSSLGIMRFFDADVAGPKITPEFVFGFAVVLIVVVLGLKIFIRL